MIRIRLEDPGMCPKTVEAPTWDAVQKVLEKHNRTYTWASFSENGRDAGYADRTLGERNWVVRKPS